VEVVAHEAESISASLTLMPRSYTVRSFSQTTRRPFEVVVEAMRWRTSSRPVGGTARQVLVMWENSLLSTIPRARVIVEHRLWSPVSVNWAGKPMLSLEAIVAYLEATTNAGGLSVSAEVDWCFHLTEAQKREAIRAMGVSPSSLPSAREVLEQMAVVERMSDEPFLSQWTYRIELR